MVTAEQEKWLEHLSDTDKIEIITWDPTCDVKFLVVKSEIQTVIGQSQEVLHRGASSLKISGQDEIDVYVPVSSDEFEAVVSTITKLLGVPKSHYLLKRARFVRVVDDKHVDVFVINKEDEDWKRSEKFNDTLLSTPSVLEDYRKLKENGSGKSVREYYREKIEFINVILDKYPC